MRSAGFARPSRRASRRPASTSACCSCASRAERPRGEAQEAFRAAIECGLDVGWCGLAEVLEGDARRDALEQCPLTWWETEDSAS
jgi:hypothetical protein